MLDAGSAGPVIVAIFRGNLRPAVGRSMSFSSYDDELQENIECHCMVWNK